MADLIPLSVSVNGVHFTRTVEPRLLLSDFLRHELGLTGTHVGCEHGSCGACTILLDGEAVRSCILFAVQTHGHAITTVEGLGTVHALHPLQEAFREQHALQCGYCTPGFLLTLVPFLQEHPQPTEAQVRDAISGNICRCTGYQNIVDAVLLASGQRVPQPAAAHAPQGTASAPASAPASSPASSPDAARAASKPGVRKRG